jgi:hypothetical protein
MRQLPAQRIPLDLLCRFWASDEQMRERVKPIGLPYMLAEVR